MEISGEAVRCPHCLCDVSGVRLLSQRVQRLETKIEEIQLRFEQEVHHESNTSLARDFSEPEDTSRSFSDHVLFPKPAWLLSSILLACGVNIFCHWLMLFVLDTNALFLRIITIVMPMIIGVFGAFQSRERMLSFITGGFVVAIFSVLGMLLVTARIDGVEWFPTNHRDQKEMLEYVVAIWFAFSTGYFVIAALNAVRTRIKAMQELSDLTVDQKGDKSTKIKALSGWLEGLISTLTPVVSAGAALYSGLKPFFD